jgi:hypothetical protein
MDGGIKTGICLYSIERLFLHYETTSERRSIWVSSRVKHNLSYIKSGVTFTKADGRCLGVNLTIRSSLIARVRPAILVEIKSTAAIGRTTQDRIVHRAQEVAGGARAHTNRPRPLRAVDAAHRRRLRIVVDAEIAVALG